MNATLQPTSPTGRAEHHGGSTTSAPPHDTDAEAAILSCLLLEPDKLDEANLLHAEHFYSPANRWVFTAIQELDRARMAIDLVTVAGWLRDKDRTAQGGSRLAEIGGAPYLARIVDAAPAVANFLEYVERVRTKWRVRAVIASCQRAAAEGYNVENAEAQNWVQSVEQQIFELAHQTHATEPAHLKDALRKVLTRIEDAAQRGSAILGTPTGFAALDELTSGLHPGDLGIVAARPGMGKTSLVLNVSVNIASPKLGERGGPDIPGDDVMVFTLEMPTEQIAMRMLCSEARVDLGKMRRNRLVQEDWDRLAQASSFLAQLPIYIDDTAAITLLELRAKVRRRARECALQGRKLGLVVVDYLQLMTSPAHAKNREQEVAVISKGLKQLAKEMKVPVIALSQMNRGVESRGGAKLPQLQDLRESGAIEQDADLVLFIHRDDYYDRDSALRGFAQGLVEKQRNGPTGSVWFAWQASSTRFDEPTPEDLQAIHDAIATKANEAQSKRAVKPEWKGGIS